MDRDEARTRGSALRVFLRSRLPVPEAKSITALARKAGLRPNTVSSWWSEGDVPDNASLGLLADALGVDLADLVAAYDGSARHSWVLTDPELQAVVERAVEAALRRVLADHDRAKED